MIRTKNFRDFVLWPVAYKMGFDPTTRLLDDQARAVGTYINLCVRKYWLLLDWPDWTTLATFAPAGHIVPRKVEPGVTKGYEIGKALKVFLADPTNTDFPVDAPFDEIDAGIFVGLDHGPTVWIKYLLPPPTYTAEVWNSSRTYKKDQVTYSPATGECYRSLQDSNINNNPAGDTTKPLNIEQTQGFIPGAPGNVTQKQTIRIFFDEVTPPIGGPDPVFGTPFGPVPDPPPNLSLFSVAIDNAAGTTIAGGTDAGDGTKTIATIINNIKTALAADVDLATFTFVVDTVNRTLDITDASNFSLHSTGTVYLEPPPNVTPNHFFRTAQIASYIPSNSPVEGTSQKTQLTLSNDDVVAQATYSVRFTSEDGVLHTASYVSFPTDSINEILQGIMASVADSQLTDSFFEGVQTSLEGSNSIVFTTVRPTGIDSTLNPAGSQWWEIVLFPFDLIVPVVRGAYAEVLKEWGQTDKGALEEQAIPNDVQMITQSGVGQMHDAPSIRTPMSKERYSQ